MQADELKLALIMLPDEVFFDLLNGIGDYGIHTRYENHGKVDAVEGILDDRAALLFSRGFMMGYNYDSEELENGEYTDRSRFAE